MRHSARLADAEFSAQLECGADRLPARGSLCAKTGQRSLDLLRWGLIPYWAKDINVGFANINAKAEDKQPYAIALAASRRSRAYGRIGIPQPASGCAPLRS